MTRPSLAVLACEVIDAHVERYALAYAERYGRAPSPTALAELRATKTKEMTQ